LQRAHSFYMPFLDWRLVINSKDGKFLFHRKACQQSIYVSIPISVRCLGAGTVEREGKALEEG
jgi:hypothetical protein